MNWSLLRCVLLAPEVIVFYSWWLPSTTIFVSSLCFFFLHLSANVYLSLFLPSLTFSHLHLLSRSPLPGPPLLPFPHRTLVSPTVIPWPSSLCGGGDSLGHSFCHLGSSFLFSNILVLKSHCPTETLISSQVGVGDMILCIKDITRAEAPKKEVRLRQGDGRPFIARNGWQDLFYWLSGPSPSLRAHAHTQKIQHLSSGLREGQQRKVDQRPLKKLLFYFN